MVADNHAACSGRVLNRKGGDEKHSVRYVRRTPSYSKVGGPSKLRDQEPISMWMERSLSVTAMMRWIFGPRKPPGALVSPDFVEFYLRWRQQVAHIDVSIVRLTTT